MKISAIIPTKNRASDLSNALKSIFDQSVLPDELIIVDQSDTVESKRSAFEILESYDYKSCVYIYSRDIKGLVEAKHVGTKHAKGEIILFLEDDIILDRQYIEVMKNCFQTHPDLVGCCGVITNPPSSSFIKRYIFDVFHTGLFHDPRNQIYGENQNNEYNLTPSNKLSGGCSAWKAQVFENIHFDTFNGFHMLEDIEFSMRVAKIYRRELYINMDAKLQHNCSPINRDNEYDRQRKKLIEYFIFYKKKSESFRHLVEFVWLLMGLLLDALFQSVRAGSIKPILGYLEGVIMGVKKTVII